MFEHASVHPTIPCTNLERARAFYEGVLGLPVVREEVQMHGVFYRVGNGYLNIFERESASAGHTVANFLLSSAELDAAVDALLAKGVTFDTWEIPGMAESPFDARGVLTTPDGQSGAWFRDPDGNVLALTNLGLP